MNAEIRYSGLTSVPSDHESPDGDLAAALNLIPEDGAVAPGSQTFASRSEDQCFPLWDTLSPAL